MKIAFLGDCVIQSPQEHTIGPNLKKIFDECQLQVINFEAPVWYEHAIGIRKSGPVIHQSAETPAWLEQNGFNVISFANNHMMDLHEEGMNLSESKFKASTIIGAGTYNNAHTARIVVIGNKKIGFIALTHKEFGCVDVNSPSSKGTADLTSPKAFVSLSAALQRCDQVYIIAHAGVEYLDYPLPEWRELYRAFIDMGASGIIASHPHVPQGYELYKGKPIFYSLGNFAFQKPDGFKFPLRWNSSLLVCIDVDTNELQWYPLGYNVKTREIELDNNPGAVQHIQSISGVIRNERQYGETIERAINDLKARYVHMAMMGGLKGLPLNVRIKGFIKSLVGRERFKIHSSDALNLFQCESHRWVMEEIIRTENFYK